MPKMRIVHDEIGNVKQVAVPGTVTKLVEDEDGKKQRVTMPGLEPTCEQVCPGHVPGHDCESCESCYAVEKDETVFSEQFMYKIDLSEPGNKKLDRRKRKRIVWSCDQSLLSPGPPPRYNMSANGNMVGITILFRDEDDNPIYPVGTLRIKAPRGKLFTKKADLDGSVEQISVNWKSPKDENHDIKFKAKIDAWHPRSYNSGTQMVMELD